MLFCLAKLMAACQNVRISMRARAIRRLFTFVYELTPIEAYVIITLLSASFAVGSSKLIDYHQKY